MLRESRYSGQEPPPKSWKGWQKVAVMAGLKDGVKDGVTAAIEAVASAQAQQAAILAGEVAAVEPEELPAPTPPRAVRETRGAEPARLERQRVTEVDDAHVVLRDFGITLRDCRIRNGVDTYRVGFLDDDGLDLGRGQDQWITAEELREGHPRGGQAIIAFEATRVQQAGVARGEPSVQEKETLRAARRTDVSPPRREMAKMRRQERRETVEALETSALRSRKRKAPQRLSRSEVTEATTIDKEPAPKKRGPGRPPKVKNKGGRPRKKPLAEEPPVEDPVVLLDTQPSESEELPRGGGAGTSQGAAPDDDPWNLIQDMAVMTTRANVGTPEERRGPGRKPKLAKDPVTGLGAGLVMDMYRGKLWESAKLLKIVDLEDMTLEIRWGEAAPKHVSAESLARREQCLPKLCQFYEQVIKTALQN